MDTKYNFFVFVRNVPMNLTKGVIYITPYGEDYVNIFRSIQQYEKNVQLIEETDTIKNIFIDRGKYTSSINFRVENPTLPRESLFIKTDESVSSIVKKLNKGYNFHKYDIFSGKDYEGIEPEDYNDMRNYIKIFYYIMMQYMSAGYNRGKNEKKIPDWCVCFCDPIMRYFIEYFEIKTEAPDIDVVDQFLTNSQFREMITIQMMKVMSNYVVNNKLINISTVESWNNIRMWLELKTKF